MPTASASSSREILTGLHNVMASKLGAQAKLNKVVKIIAGACASTGIIYATNFHGMKPLIDAGSEEQKRRLLPRIAKGGLASLAITEPEAGSDATGMRTRFRPDGDQCHHGNQQNFTEPDIEHFLHRHSCESRNP